LIRFSIPTDMHQLHDAYTIAKSMTTPPSAQGMGVAFPDCTCAREGADSTVSCLLRHTSQRGA
jgi:hypothetical protein